MGKNLSSFFFSQIQVLTSDILDGDMMVVGTANQTVEVMLSVNNETGMVVGTIKTDLEVVAIQPGPGGKGTMYIRTPARAAAATCEFPAPRRSLGPFTSEPVTEYPADDVFRPFFFGDLVRRGRQLGLPGGIVPITLHVFYTPNYLEEQNGDPLQVLMQVHADGPVQQQRRLKGNFISPD